MQAALTKVFAVQQAGEQRQNRNANSQTDMSKSMGSTPCSNRGQIFEHAKTARNHECTTMNHVIVEQLHGAPVNRGTAKLKELLQPESEHQFTTPQQATTAAPSPKVTSPPDSSPRVPQNLFGTTRAIPQGVNGGNILNHQITQ